MTQTISIFVHALQLRLENDLVHSKVLRWPESTLIDTSAVRINSLTKSRTQSLVKSGFPRYFSSISSIDPIWLCFRQLPETVEHGRIEIVFVPGERQVSWKKPVPIFFDYVVWPIQDFWIVAVPMLGIEFQLKSHRELEEKVEERIRKVLSIREGRSLGLERLWEFRRIQSARLVSLPVAAELPTMPENVKREHGHAVKNATTEQWEELGITFLDRPESLPTAYGMEPLLRRLEDTISRDEPSPILLVGNGGVGKTALWLEYARRSQTSNKAKFGETDATALVSSSTDPDSCCGADWQSRCDQLIRLASQEPVVLHFGNLWELTQVGMWIGQSRSLGAQLIPAASGRFPFFCECTPQQLAVLEQEHPGLLFPFVKIELDEPDEKTALEIYRRVAESTFPGVFDDAALRRTDALHRRYATYSSIPGRPLVFLRNLGLSATERKESEDVGQPATITETDVVKAFSRETGLPLLLLDDSIPMDVDETLDWFRKRIVGQDASEGDGAPGAASGAIALLVETLLTYKARLSRPDRPIASLLLVGPTGVGKTETAKALAEFLYSDPKRMIRIDMSEFAEYGAAERLIRGNMQDEGLLTMKVRQQPFSVVLLDEFEKAHEKVFDLLLQVLGEGRLTDAAGRVADFRNCVILMTSNIGVERFGQPKAGFETGTSQTADARSVEHFTNEVSRLLRPEMLNRIDRIVPFRPLSKESLRKILDLQIGKLDERYGISGRPLTLRIDDDVYDFLVEKSYDPRFGARPLRRILEQQLLVSLAGALKNYSPETSVEVHCSLSDGPESDPDGRRIRCEVTVRRSDADSVRVKTSRWVELHEMTSLRRKIRVLLEHSTVEEMEARLNRAEKLRRKIERQQRKRHDVFVSPENLRFLDRVEKVDKVFVQRIGELREDIVRLEESALLEYYRDRDLATGSRNETVSLQAKYRRLVDDLYLADQGSRDRILLIVYSNSPETMETVLRLYEDCSALFGFQTIRYALEPWTSPGDFQTVEKADRLLFNSRDETLLAAFRNGILHLDRENWKRCWKLLQVVHARCVSAPNSETKIRRSQPAFLLDVSGHRAGLLLAEEFGKHRLIGPKPAQRQSECSVEVSFESLGHYFPQIDSSGNVQIHDPCIRRTVELDEGKPKRPDSIRDAPSLKTVLENRFAEIVENWINE